VHAGDSGLVCSDRSGTLVARTGVPLADVYLEFLGGRCRPNTVRAAAYDLKVFFTVVAKPPDEVGPADVLAFITAQRTGQAGERGALQPLQARDEPGGVSAATVRRRLSIVSGFFAFLQARGDVAANPVPRGLPARRERSRPGQGVPLVRAVRQLPRILAPAEVDALMAAPPRPAVHLAARPPRPGRLMTRPPLRLTRPGQLPAPATGPDSLQVLDEAIDQLARLRTPYWLGDSTVRLHALTSLIAQAQQLLPQAVHDARDQELTWTQIGELLGTTAATAARRYREKP